jgi:hypothetical protein
MVALEASGKVALFAVEERLLAFGVDSLDVLLAGGSFQQPSEDIASVDLVVATAGLGVHSADLTAIDFMFG